MSADGARPGGRRRALLDAVGDLLVEDGFPSLGPNAVARRASANKQLIYHHFGTFEGLLGAWADAQDLWPSVDELVGGDPARFISMSKRARWATLVRRYVRGMRARPATLAVVVWTLSERTPIDAQVVGGRDAILSEVGELFTDVPRHARELLLVLLVSVVESLATNARVRPRFGPLPLSSDADWDDVETLLVLSGGPLLEDR